MSVHSVVAYVSAIRNPVKKAYATAYLKWLDGAWGTQAKDGPEPIVPSSLSCMAAQAVRLRLHKLLGK